jgi:hypothetical protein
VFLLFLFFFFFFSAVVPLLQTELKEKRRSRKGEEEKTRVEEKASWAAIFQSQRFFSIGIYDDDTVSLPGDIFPHFPHPPHPPPHQNLQSSAG